MKKGIILSGLLILLLGLTFFSSAWSVRPHEMSIEEEWKAPNEANTIKNPIKGNISETEAGKKLFNQLCVICHGSKGKGDGMAGISLYPRPSNLTTEKVQKQTDGALFWKISEGKAPMATYKNVLKEEQRWQLVNYIRTLNH